MNRWRRAAEINKGMIIVLVVLAVIVGGFYAFKCRSVSTEQQEIEIDRPDTYTLYCPECDKEFVIPGDEWKDVAKKDGKLQCPECKQFVAKWGKKKVDTGIVPP